MTALLAQLVNTEDNDQNRILMTCLCKAFNKAGENIMCVKNDD